MKKILFFLLIFLIQLSTGQKLTINVSDAVSKKRISDASVFLEAYGKESIRAKYKKGAYMFDKIPVGFTTIMVYHDNYNEKGFQKFDVFPDKINIRLNKSSEIRYIFDRKKLFYFDSRIGYSNFQMKYAYYVEDPYKIIIRHKSLRNEDSRNYIENYLKKNGIGLEMINPYYEEELGRYKRIKAEDPTRTDYDSLLLKKPLDYEYFPLMNSLDADSTSYWMRGKKVANPEKAYFFRQKSGEKFKRFNDPVLKIISQDSNLEALSVVYYKGTIDNVAADKPVKEFFKYRDLRSEKLLKDCGDLSKCFLYDNTARLIKYDGAIVLISPGDDMSENIPRFTIIHKNRKIPETLRNQIDSSRETSEENTPLVSIPDFDPGIGLGILDLYEYYFEKIELRGD